jgi:alkylation response protein AidB-like acyl-CoA dehydrogenase
MGQAVVRSHAATPTVADSEPPNNELLAALQCVEEQLHDLQSALGACDVRCIELHAGQLQRALSLAAERFVPAARRAGTSPPLRHRLLLANAQVTAQRDALARASAALDRAIGVLMPRPGSAVYSQSGAQQPLRGRSSLEV